MSIELRHAAACYQSADGEVEAVRDVSFAVTEGAFVSLVGPSGCGKSTLLSAIAGLEPLSGGSIRIDGQPVEGTSPKVGFMPQRDQLFEWRNIWDNVTLGLTVRGEKDAAAYAHVSELLERYGLAAFAKKKPCQLSGGMRQRCALIRTLATQPEILLLDEPFSALDFLTRVSMREWLLDQWERSGKTILFITHDVEEALFLSGRVLVAAQRPIRELQSVPVPLSAPRTMESLAAPEIQQLGHMRIGRRVLLAADG